MSDESRLSKFLPTLTKWSRENQWSSLILRLLVVVLLMFFANFNDYVIRWLTHSLILYLLCVSYNGIFGSAGLMSLAQASIFGFGAYSSVILNITLGVNFWVSLVLATFLSALLSAIIVIPTLRLGGIYLALATLGFAVAVQEIFTNATNLTGGSQGFLGITSPTLLGMELNSGEVPFLVFVAIVVVIADYIFSRSYKSKLGLKLISIRESKIDSEASGINIDKLRLFVFVTYGGLSGLAGVLFAYDAKFLSPDSFGLSLMIRVLIIVLIGGSGTKFGPLAGASLILLVDETGKQVGDMSILLFGSAIVFLLAFAPMGIVGTFQRKFKLGRVLKEHVHSTSGSARVTKEKSTDLLEVRSVSVEFAGLKALNDVSFSVSPGEIVGLIGPNGAGKTTLLNVVTAHVVPSQGGVFLGSEKLNDLKPFELARKGVGRTFQHSTLIHGISLIENVVLGSVPLESEGLFSQFLNTKKSRIELKKYEEDGLDILEDLGILEYAFAMTEDVPYGILRRAEIAKCLAMNPMFLLLDEPGAGLSNDEHELIAESIRSCAKRGIGCLLIDHNIGFVSALCQKLVVLEAGGVIASGEVSDVLNSSQVINAYLGNVS